VVTHVFVENAQMVEVRAAAQCDPARMKKTDALRRL
jgi:hypothetical protein